MWSECYPTFSPQERAKGWGNGVRSRGNIAIPPFRPKNGRKDGARSNADGDVRVTAVPPPHGRRPVRGGPGPGGRRYTL
jgi:hypothetical protein